jgi:hypothetical protein
MTRATFHRPPVGLWMVNMALRPDVNYSAGPKAVVEIGQGARSRTPKLARVMFFCSRPHRKSR